MIDRLLGYFEVGLLRHLPQWSVSIRSRRYHQIKEDKSFLELYDRLQKQKRLIQSVCDAYNLYRLCAQTGKISGDVAELGVFRGGSARLLGAVKQRRQLRLFDTFDEFGGMPKVRGDIDKHSEGDFKDTRFVDVKTLMAGVEGVNFYPGFFPDSTASLQSSGDTYSCVHLDVDIYQSTLDGLKYFYPRLSRGGMIVSHDYRYLQCPGVKKAFDEFFADKPETVLELWDTQALVVKQ